MRLRDDTRTIITHIVVIFAGSMRRKDRENAEKVSLSKFLSDTFYGEYDYSAVARRNTR